MGALPGCPPVVGQTVTTQVGPVCEVPSGQVVVVRGHHRHDQLKRVLPAPAQVSSIVSNPSTRVVISQPAFGPSTGQRTSRFKSGEARPRDPPEHESRRCARRFDHCRLTRGPSRHDPPKVVRSGSMSGHRRLVGPGQCHRRVNLSAEGTEPGHPYRPIARADSKRPPGVSLTRAPGAKSVIAVNADLTEDEGRNKIIHVAAERFGALDLAVNAAGVGATGHFDTHDPTVLRRVFEINVFALVEMTRALLPLLRRGDRPSLVNLGSIVARRACPAGRSTRRASSPSPASPNRSRRVVEVRHPRLLHQSRLHRDRIRAESRGRHLAIPHPAEARDQRRPGRGRDTQSHPPRGTTNGPDPGRPAPLARQPTAPRLVNVGFARFTRRIFRDVVLESPDWRTDRPSRSDGCPARISTLECNAA